jgi:hypothetical protein
MLVSLSQAPFDPNPPARRPLNAGTIAAWGALVAVTGGVLYMTLRGQPGRPVSANRRSARKNRVGGKVKRVRSAVASGRCPSLSAAGASKRVVSVAKSLPEGLFRVTSKGDVIVYRDDKVTDGVLTSTRIAASKSPSTQTWLVQVMKDGAGRRRTVPVRGSKRSDGRVDTVFRVEEA